MSPPYNRDAEQVGRMTDQQIFAFFAVERDSEGRPKPPRLADRPKTAFDYFADRCFLGGVWDRGEIERLWPAEQKRLEAL